MRDFKDLFWLARSLSIQIAKSRGRLDESCPIEEHPERRRDAYCYAKVKQEQMVSEYAKNFWDPKCRG